MITVVLLNRWNFRPANGKPFNFFLLPDDNFCVAQKQKQPGRTPDLKRLDGYPMFSQESIKAGQTEPGNQGGLFHVLRILAQ